MSSISPVAICSNALQLLGAAPIASFDEDSKWAGVAANLWPLVRDALLRAHPWNCATRRVILAPLVEKPPFDYGFQFQLPGDWLKTVQVGRRGYTLDFRTEGRMILAHVNALPLVYIWRNETTNTWDDGLVEVATKKMQAALAYPVTASTSLRDSLTVEAQQMLKSAKAGDGQDDPPEEFPESEFQRARYRG